MPMRRAEEFGRLAPVVMEKENWDRADGKQHSLKF